MSEMMVWIIVCIMLASNLIFTMWMMSKLRKLTKAGILERQALAQATTDLQLICARLNAHLTSLTERSSSAVTGLATGGATNDRLYEQAIRMARAGATAEQLVASYGLSHGEAELLLLLHRQSS
jgi:hypothetical protein